jgi:hypothetical protein
VTTHYGDIAFTDSVSAVQQRYGSRDFYGRRARRRSGGGPDPITPDVREYLAVGDSVYLPRSGRRVGPTSSSVAVRQASCGSSTTTQ